MNRELSKSLDVLRADVELMAIRVEHLERIEIAREEAEKSEALRAEARAGKPPTAARRPAATRSK